MEKPTEIKIESSWKEALKNEFQQQYFQQLTDFVRAEYQAKAIFPPGKLIFNAFNLCPLDKVKVVILGQDPYHGKGQAEGLSFSVPDGVSLPPSLQNILKEIKADLGKPSQIELAGNGSLKSWAEQGVLLLNATLTVQAGLAGSHQGKGWETFTDGVIRLLSNEREGLVFILWGAYAQAKAELIDSNKHLVLKAAHPSPFSAYKGFFGCKHFSKANQYLLQSGKPPIEW